MYNLFADLSERTKDSVTPFVIVNLSNDQYLEFPENHVVAFAEKDRRRNLRDRTGRHNTKELDSSTITVISRQNRQDRHGDRFT